MVRNYSPIRIMYRRVAYKYIFSTNLLVYKSNNKELLQTQSKYIHMYVYSITYIYCLYNFLIKFIDNRDMVTRVSWKRFTRWKVYFGIDRLVFIRTEQTIRFLATGCRKLAIYNLIFLCCINLFLFIKCMHYAYPKTMQLMYVSN